jgi:hypothetical protein
MTYHERYLPWGVLRPSHVAGRRNDWEQKNCNHLREKMVKHIPWKILGMGTGYLRISAKMDKMIHMWKHASGRVIISSMGITNRFMVVLGWGVQNASASLLRESLYSK